jgi:ribosomal-protein-alanine N-acetyltransferase
VFTFASIRQTTPEIRGDGLLIRSPRQNDYQVWRSLRLASRSFLAPFEPRWSEVDLSARNFTTRVRRNRRDALYGTEFSFFIFTQSGRRSTLVGGLTLSNVRRRAFQNVTLGYWMGAEFAGKGIMTRSVALILSSTP